MGVDYDEVIYPDKEGDETWTQAKPKLGMDCPNVSQHFVKKIKEILIHIVFGDA